jgi:hypothetical protein
VEVQPMRGGNDHQGITGPGPHRQRLEHLADLMPSARASSTDV